MLHGHASTYPRVRTRRARPAAGALGAAIAVLATLPAAAAAVTLPVGGVLQTVGSVTGSAPAAPAAPTITSATPCPGAHRRAAGARQSIAVWCLVNRTRARAGLQGLAGNVALARAASRQARDMIRHHYFAHQRAGGPALAARARRAGWSGSHLGEAIAFACGRLATPAGIVGSWLRSPPHRAILLGGAFAKVGVAVVKRAPVACGGATYVLDAGR
ncbi:MAG: hypothetical protein QOE28_748 [Solirubrobacteraceae bacterium]|jgi:uncharacterized protein YkwD|nr:hypothetical protein [Solirubrobacteraceae bacterium]